MPRVVIASHPKDREHLLKLRMSLDLALAGLPENIRKEIEVWDERSVKEGEDWEWRLREEEERATVKVRIQTPNYLGQQSERSAVLVVTNDGEFRNLEGLWLDYSEWSEKICLLILQMLWPVRSLSVSNWTVFQKIELSFLPGINIIFGTNKSGKTNLLKLVYFLSMTGNAPVGENSDVLLNSKIIADLASLFLPQNNDLSRLIRRTGRVSQDLAEVRREAFVPGGFARAGFILNNQKTVTVEPAWLAHIRHPVFIPTNDVLAMYEGFNGLYKTRQISFDKTYGDICDRLSQAPLRILTPAAQDLINLLLLEIGGDVIRDGNRFYVGTDSEKIEAHRLSEGQRKLATLVQLLRTGDLQVGTVLLWDEPETNLNPKWIVVIVRVLDALARMGVQLILATHDYLLASRLSLLSEYRDVIEPKPALVRFFSLYRETEEGDVTVETADRLHLLQHNPIFDEYSTLYDEEHRLIAERRARK